MIAAGFPLQTPSTPASRPVEQETASASASASVSQETSPPPGETWILVGQIAKIKGCRVVGLAGTDEKCRIVTEEFGMDACINYKTEPLLRAFRKSCPDGIDVYFDNVGGTTIETILRMINRLVEPDEVLDAAIKLAESVSKAAPIAVVETLALARVANQKSEPELWQLSDELGERLLKTEDFWEGPRAFAEKRSPVWKGR